MVNTRQLAKRHYHCFTVIPWFIVGTDAVDYSLLRVDKRRVNDGKELRESGNLRSHSGHRSGITTFDYQNHRLVVYRFGQCTGCTGRLVSGYRGIVNEFAGSSLFTATGR